MTLAVIDEQPVGTTPCRDDQVQIAIAVNVHERRPDGMLSRTSDAGTRSNILEAPVAQITIEHVRPVDGAKIKVAQTIAIHIACRNTAGNQGWAGAKTPRGIGESNAGLG